jgi:hypothetical protein
MTLIIEDGKVVNRTNKSVDEVKRESFKHSSQPVKEESEQIESFTDNLEELEDDSIENEVPNGADPNAVEIAVAFAEFKAEFAKLFGEEELQDAFLQFDEFFKGRGIDINLDFNGLAAEAEIPGLESSRQEIMASDIEEEIDHTREQFRAFLERKKR